ncbi:MAG TPA: hypothetical protein ENN22_02370, partial [bacterium]|nr:hypothetical protein [bacterium]
MSLKILLITNFFPPANTVASHRLYSFARYLPEFGIDVDVFTPERKGTLTYDLQSIKQIHPYQDFSEINKFSRDSNYLRSLVRLTGLVPLFRYLHNQIYLKGKSYFLKERIQSYDAIFISFGPENVLRLGQYLSRKFRIPLIIDYRDLWLNYLFSNPSLFDQLI